MTVAVAVADRASSQDVSGTQGQRGRSTKTAGDGGEAAFREILSSVTEEGREAAAPDIPEGDPDTAPPPAPADWASNDTSDDRTEDAAPASAGQADTGVANALQMVGAALGLKPNTSPAMPAHAKQSGASAQPQMPSALALDLALGKLRLTDRQQAGQATTEMPAIQTSDDAMPDMQAATTVDTHETQLSVQRKETHHAPSVSVAPESPHGPGAANVGAGANQDGASQGNRNTGSEAASMFGREAASADGNGDTVTGTGQQTHMVREPGRLSSEGLGSPAEQVADGILKELGGASRSEMRSDATSAPTSKASTLSGVKILHIQLQPADLGTVSVRIELKNDAVDVQLEVAHAETARLVRKHHETLADMLRSAGYTTDRIGIQVTDIDKPSTFSQQSSHQSAQSQQQNASQAQGGWQNSNGHAGADARDARRSGERDVEAADRVKNADAETGNAKASVSGVYI